MSWMGARVLAQHRSRFRVGRIAGGLEDAAARVVDEDVDGRQARQPGGDGVGVREVQRVQGDAGGAVASGGGLCEGVWPAGDEVQVVAACGGMAGERGAKAAAGAGDEEGEHGVFLFVCGGFGFRLFVLQMCLARRCNAV